jgi:hypothetical protein
MAIKQLAAEQASGCAKTTTTPERRCICMTSAAIGKLTAAIVASGQSMA